MSEPVRATSRDVFARSDLDRPEHRALFDWWRSRGDAPGAAAFDPTFDGIARDFLVALKRVGPHRFVYLHYGEGLQSLTDLSLAGQALELAGYDPRHNVAAQIADLYVRKYEECIVRRQAMITLNQAQNNARIHAWERLLVPFGGADDEGAVVVGDIRPQLFRHEVLASLSRIAQFGSATLEPIRGAEGARDFMMIEATALAPVLGGQAPVLLSGLLDRPIDPALAALMARAEPGTSVLRETRRLGDGPGARVVEIEVFVAPVRCFVTVRDVTSLERATALLAERTEQLREAHRLGSIGSWRRGFDSDHIEWSPETYELLRYDPAVFETTLDNVVGTYVDGTGAGVQRIVGEVIATGRTLSADVRYRRGDGTIADCVVTCRPERAEDGTIRGIFGTMQDITARKSAERELERLAFYDPLTGLANRALFKRRLEETIAGGGMATLLLIDLDRFKEVNDSLGHAAGDQLLVRVGDLLRREVVPGDLVARLGGDEFAIITERDPEEAAGLGARLVALLGTPLKLASGEAFVGASIGLACLPDDAVTVDGALRNADLALYAAKSAGRGRLQRYRPALAEAVEQRLDLARHLRQAVVDGGLSAHFQPQVALGSGLVEGFEVLMRWTHPERGPISPSEFIPIAESSGLIVDLGVWILREACRQGRAWLDAGAPGRVLAVNVSPAQLFSGEFEAAVARVLAETGYPAQALCLELTESVFVDQSVARVERILRALSRLGVKLALDDFGTGYSSLGYLTRLPFDRLKVARPFVDGCGTIAKKRKLLEGVIALGRGLGMTVVRKAPNSPSKWRRWARSAATSCRASISAARCRPGRHWSSPSASRRSAASSTRCRRCAISPNGWRSRPRASRASRLCRPAGGFSGLDRNRVVEPDPAAVGEDGLARDVAGRVRGEEHGDARDLRGVAEAAHRRAREHLLARGLVGQDGRQHLGRDRARPDRIDADAVRGQRERHDVGELRDPALRHAVGHLVGDRELGVDRGHVDDRARRLAGRDLLDHAPRRGLTDQERALQVDPQHAVEITLGDVEEVRRVDDPGVVDEDVDVAEGVHRLGDEVVDVELLAHVAGDVDDLAELRERGRRLRAQMVVDVADDDPGAGLEVGLRDGTADAACRAGDDRDLVVELHGELRCAKGRGA